MSRTLPEAEPVDLRSMAARRDLALLVTSLFGKWELDNDTQLRLLGLSRESRKLLPAYRTGARALPNQVDLLARAGHLLGIHKALRFLFPEDEQLRYGWVKRRNAMLDNATPLEVMLDVGFLGFARVARFADFLRGQ